MNLFGMALDEAGKTPIIILKDEPEQMVVPIWIGVPEAMSISMALNKVPFPRPMTHDLMVNLIMDLGGTLDRIEVTAIEEGTFYAELIILKDGEELRTDCRPSDAVAIAVRVDVPIFVAQQVIDDAGTPNEAYETLIKTDEADRWADELDKLQVDETKYKM